MVSQAMVLPQGPRRWAQALLAALPHLFFALSTIVSNRLGNALLPVLMIGALLLAWRARWPLWAGGWIGYWLIFLVFTPGSYMAAGSPLQYLPFLLLPLFALLVVRRPRHALLGLLPLLLLVRLFQLELIADDTLVWTSAYLLLALTTAAIVWSGRLATALWLVTALQLLIGLIFALAATMLPYRGMPGGPPQARPLPDPATVINSFAPATLAAIGALLALLLLHALWRLAADGGRRSRRAYVLLLLAMSLTLGGNLVFRQAAFPITLPFGERLSFSLPTAAVLAGLFLTALAGVYLLRSTGSLRRVDLLWVLLSVFAPLVIFQLPAPFPPSGVSTGYHLSLLLSYLGTLTWIAVAFLTLTRWARRLPQPEDGIQPIDGSAT